VRLFREAIYVYPEDVCAYIDLGNALYGQKESDEAIAAYRAAIDLHPKHASAYIGLGNALSGRKELDEAIAAFRKAIELDPKSARAYNSLAARLSDRPKEQAPPAERVRNDIELDANHAEASVDLGAPLYHHSNPHEPVP